MRFLHARQKSVATRSVYTPYGEMLWRLNVDVSCNENVHSDNCRYGITNCRYHFLQEVPASDTEKEVVTDWIDTALALANDANPSHIYGIV